MKPRASRAIGELSRKVAVPSAILALLLVFAQWAQLEHLADLHAHDKGGVCEVCLLWQSSDDLAVDTGTPQRVVIAAEYFFPANSDVIANRAISAPLARGPPLTLS